MSTDLPTDTTTVSPPSPSAATAAGKAERLKAYRRAYWLTFKRDHVRVYGTLTKAEHTEIKRIAERSGRSVWEQIWRESLAYRRGDYLPTTDIAARIEGLYGQLRAIGNNLNQIARRANISGQVRSPRDVLRQVEYLEGVIADFVKRPWTRR